MLSSLPVNTDAGAVVVSFPTGEAIMALSFDLPLTVDELLGRVNEKIRQCAAEGQVGLCAGVGEEVQLLDGENYYVSEDVTLTDGTSLGVVGAQTHRCALCDTMGRFCPPSVRCPEATCQLLLCDTCSQGHRRKHRAIETAPRLGPELCRCCTADAQVICASCSGAVVHLLCRACAAKHHGGHRLVDPTTQRHVALTSTVETVVASLTEKVAAVWEDATTPRSGQEPAVTLASTLSSGYRQAVTAPLLSVVAKPVSVVLSDAHICVSETDVNGTFTVAPVTSSSSTLDECFELVSQTFYASLNGRQLARPLLGQTRDDGDNRLIVTFMLPIQDTSVARELVIASCGVQLHDGTISISCTPTKRRLKRQRVQGDDGDEDEANRVPRKRTGGGKRPQTLRKNKPVRSTHAVDGDRHYVVHRQDGQLLLTVTTAGGEVTTIPVPNAPDIPVMYMDVGLNCDGVLVVALALWSGVPLTPGAVAVYRHDIERKQLETIFQTATSAPIRMLIASGISVTHAGATDRIAYIAAFHREDITLQYITLKGEIAHRVRIKDSDVAKATFVTLLPMLTRDGVGRLLILTEDNDHQVILSNGRKLTSDRQLYRGNLLPGSLMRLSHDPILSVAVLGFHIAVLQSDADGHMYCRLLLLQEIQVIASSTKSKNTIVDGYRIVSCEQYDVPDTSGCQHPQLGVALTQDGKLALTLWHDNDATVPMAQIGVCDITVAPSTVLHVRKELVQKIAPQHPDPEHVTLADYLGLCKTDVVR